MSLIEQGRVCMKIAGREAGRYCVVLEVGGEFATVSGPKNITGVKKRKCNVAHLEPFQEVFKVSSGSDEELEKLWKESGLIDKLGIKVQEKKVKKEKKPKKRSE